MVGGMTAGPMAGDIAEIQRWLVQYYKHPGLIPEDVREDIERVLLAIRKAVLYDIKPGSFSKAVLRNDLMAATAHIDEKIRPYVWIFPRYVYNEMPADLLGKWR